MIFVFLLTILVTMALLYRVLNNSKVTISKRNERYEQEFRFIVEPVN